jgi:hypothetical protein
MTCKCGEEPTIHRIVTIAVGIQSMDLGIGLECLVRERDRYKAALECFSLGAHFHDSIDRPFSPEMCPGCVSKNLLHTSSQ